jgi:hypothetical protein
VAILRSLQPRFVSRASMAAIIFAISLILPSAGSAKIALVPGS